MQKQVDSIGELVEVTITGLDGDLRGTTQWQGLTLHVEGGTPGDLLKVRLESISRHHPLAYGSIDEVLEWGEAFLSPPCPRAAPIRGRCGGCPGMHIVPAVQDKVRRDHVDAELKSLGLSVALRWHESEERLGYRNRSNYAVTRRRDGDVILGSFAPRSRKVVSMKGCLVVRPVIAEVQEMLRKMIGYREIPTDNSPEALRWISLRASEGDKVVVELVTTVEEPLWLEHFAHGLMKIKQIRGVVVSIHDEETNTIRDSEPRVVGGEGAVRDTFGAISIDIVPGAFAQLNSAVASQMYLRAAELVEGPGVVWDLYAGLGGLGLNLAFRHQGSRVFGADAVEASITAANDAAAKYELDAHYEVANLKRALPENWPAPDTIIVNPPRKGLDKIVLEGISKTEAKTLLYMSCDPRSFARDLTKLVAAGWKLEPVDIYDMLPQTARVELLAKLVRD